MKSACKCNVPVDVFLGTPWLIKQYDSFVDKEVQRILLSSDVPLTVCFRRPLAVVE
jgi:hypothetical protein